MASLHYKIVFAVGVIIFLDLNFECIAQVKNTDSLENILRNKPLSITGEMNICYELGEAFVKTNFEKSKLYARRGMQLAEKLNNERMWGMFLNTIGAVYLMASQYDSAAFYISKAKAIGEKLKDDRLVALSTMKEATLNTRTAKYAEALKKFFNALAWFEKADDKKNIRLTTSNIAALYMYQENFLQAEKYYRQALLVAREIKEGSGIGQSCEGLSRIFMKHQQYDSSMQYAVEAAEAFASVNEKAFQSVATQQIAMNYLKTSQIEKAGAYAQKALQLAKEPNSTRYVADATGFLAEVYFYKKDYPGSKKYALQALQIDSSDNELRSRMLYYLVKTSIYTNDREKAVKFLNDYRNVIDTRANENYQHSLSEMEVKYQTEKKELKIASMKKEKKLGITLTVLGAALALAVITLLSLRQRIINHKKEIAEQKIIQLEQEKKLVATQAVLDGETAERTRLARDLHDGLGGMLSVIKLNLYDVKKGVHIEGEDALRFNQALEMLESSTRELRRVAHNMMPEALSRFGLKTSLKDFVRNIPNATFHFFGDDKRLEPKLESMIYRTAYELVNNALKHAHANNINIQVIQHPDTISLTVEDDGKGFITTETSDGQGLQNIHYRVQSFGGSMNVFSQPAEGTEINVEFKINP